MRRQPIEIDHSLLAAARRMQLGGVLADVAGQGRTVDLVAGLREPFGGLREADEAVAQGPDPCIGACTCTDTQSYAKTPNLEA